MSIQRLGNGDNLPDRFRKARNAGERVDLFFDKAKKDPEAALNAFVNILEYKASPAMRALALRGLGEITHPPIRRALTSCETEEDLQVLRDVAKEVKGKGEISSDLTQWAAASAIETLGFPLDAIEHLEGGALTDPPRRIRNEIINRRLQEINTIQEKDSRGETTPEYERNLEFWLYGPTEELFRANSTSTNYENLVTQVIDQLHVRGIELAIDKDQNLKIDDAKKRRWLQVIALQIAAEKFRDTESTEIQQRRLFENIGYFLSNYYNDDIFLRRLAAQAILNAGAGLPSSIKARAFVICERWREAKAIGEVARVHPTFAMSISA